MIDIGEEELIELGEVVEENYEGPMTRQKSKAKGKGKQRD